MKMSLRFTIAFLSVALPATCLAQATTEIKDIRFYEHHSSGLSGGLPYGFGANGSQSGYDFVAHDYYSSFNPATMGSWSAAEIVNIDMVENDGGYVGPFGFTSDTSTTWGGMITGNNLTVYAEAPASFNYDLATNVAYIKAAFPATTTKTINAVAVNKIYLAKIRGTELYVAMKITAVQNVPAGATPTVSVFDVYFDFDYKYGTFIPTSTTDVPTNQRQLTISPNPSKGTLVISDMPELLKKGDINLSIFDVMGRVVHQERLQRKEIQHQLQPGNYIVQVSDGASTYRNRLVVVQ